MGDENGRVCMITTSAEKIAVFFARLHNKCWILEACAINPAPIISALLCSDILYDT
jgi:hypothetical protein